MIIRPCGPCPKRKMCERWTRIKNVAREHNFGYVTIKCDVFDTLYKPGQLVMMETFDDCYEINVLCAIIGPHKKNLGTFYLYVLCTGYAGSCQKTDGFPINCGDCSQREGGLGENGERRFISLSCKRIEKGLIENAFVDICPSCHVPQCCEKEEHYPSCKIACIARY